MDVTPIENLLNMSNSELPGAGTTKRKELHGMVPVRALSGKWRDKLHGAVLHSYRIDFSCDSENFSSFLLLTESNLDHDVANAKMDLYLLDRTAISSVSPSGEVHLDSDQIKRGMRFHELLFNGLFGKLFLGSKAEGTPREFLLQKDSAWLWSTDTSYLILPLESSDVEDHASWRINWKAVDSCVTVVEYMKSFCWLTAELSQRKTKSSCLDEYCASKNHVNLANCTFSMGNLKDTVVISIHTGRIYYVLDVLVDTSAHSPFEASRKPKYSTFADYFTKKYEIELLYPEQPLLLLKQTRNAFNLLSDSEATALRRKMLSDGTDQRPQNHVHMPPELVVSIDVPLSVLRAFYLIPSVMHRLECLMLAGQFREEIGLNIDKFNIPSLLLLEALTTQRCLEDFSSERLELLGDSVLKYSVSCHLFLTYPEKQEGKLSAHRQQAICNATLHYLGIKGGLQEYIRDSPFEPRRWVAPGQLSVHPTSCLHGIDSSKVPLDSKYQNIDEKLVLGKNCDKGHRWLVSKNIADCVEAVIGAYYVAGGLAASIHVMTWLGIEAKLDMGYVDKAVDVASDRPFAQKVDEITTLESKLGYDFSTKGLLIEAITHSTYENAGVKYCYERLEFLGDAVLDVLMTWHLYQNHKDIDPGELTDLRAASVNNENFAQVAVRRNLFLHLLHSSSLLAEQVTDYVNLITKAEGTKTLQGRQCPKALGDLVESIAGAILIDTKLQIDEVWRVVSPIVTPENLELVPFRELNELCDRRGYFFKEQCVNHNQVIFVELKLQLTDILLIGEGIARTRKAARGEASFHLLKDLEDRGISFAHVVGEKRKREPHDVTLCSLDGTITLDIVPHKKQKVAQVPIGGVPAISSVNAQKGGPRSSLYDLCKRLQWPMPSFETTGRQLITPIEVGEGANKKKGFNSYTSKISLCGCAYLTLV
ncbi:endoribonuclease Dicer homolog 3-like [Silene latifolia]|uniref:endoribonuclease Dicer homolog 3-like n=1 Tax=Silene latifolia TaxID=37657 RepID=UPI003D7843B0